MGFSDSERASETQIQIFREMNERILKKDVPFKIPSFWNHIGIVDSKNTFLNNNKK